MHRMLDLHVHPSLKMYYLPYLTSSFHAFVYCGKHFNPLSFRTQYRHLNKSPVKVMLSTHYVIEQGFVREGIKGPGRALSWLISPVFYAKLRRSDPWKVLMGMMETLENSVPNTNKFVTGDGKRFKMVRRYSEIADLKDNEIGLIHTIEGSHALGYGPGKGQSLEDFWKQTEERLEYLKSRGVALITLAHFWDNMFAPQTCGTEIVPKEKDGQIVGTPDDALFHMKRATWQWDDEGKLAERFARKLLEMGILIDLAHTQQHARWRIYDLCEEYKRPVIASHNGLQHFFNHEYNLSDEEIKRFHKLGGVIGLILSRRWLVDPEKRHKTDRHGGIADIVENMLYIRDMVGDVSCIGIGTDFDGLTDPFKDCATPDKLWNMIDYMGKYFTDDEIDQIMYRNGERALEKGWT